MCEWGEHLCVENIMFHWKVLFWGRGIRANSGWKGTLSISFSCLWVNQTETEQTTECVLLLTQCPSSCSCFQKPSLNRLEISCKNITLFNKKSYRWGRTGNGKGNTDWESYYFLSFPMTIGLQCYLVGRSTTLVLAEIAQQLLDRLLWTFVQKFVVFRGWILRTLVISKVKFLVFSEMS